MRDPEARDLATRVARYLGAGWAADPSWDGYGAILDGPDGARLHLNPPREGKVHVSGCFPMTDMRVTGCGVNIGASRPPAVIAAEITRRLLPGYLGQLREVIEHNEQDQRDTEARAGIIGKIAAMFPGGHVRTAGHRGTYTEALIHPAGCGSGSVEAYGDASAVKIDLHGVPLGLAMAMLAVLADRPGWVRIDDEHPRWEIKNPNGDGRNYLCTDEAIRTYGRRHVETVVLRNLPPLPADAWAVTS